MKRVPIIDQFITAYIESEGVSSTQSTYPTYVNKVTLTLTPSLAGNYMLFWFCEIANSNSSAEIYVRVKQGSNIYSEERVGVLSTYGNNGWHPISGIKQVSLTTSQISFNIDYCRVVSPQTVYIRRARLFLIRLI